MTLAEAPLRRAPSRSARVRDKQDARRQEIVDAAIRLFNRQSYDNVSIRDLELESRLTRGPIYYYFRNKEEIYGEVVKTGLLQIQGRIAKAIAAQKTPRMRLRAVIDTYLDEYERARNTFDVLARFFFGMRPNVEMAPHLLDDVSKLLRANLDVVVDVIRDGVRQGVFQTSDPDFAVMAMWGMMTSVVQMHDENLRMQSVGRPRAQLRRDIHRHIFISLGAKA